MYTLILSAALLADATLVQTMTMELNPNLPPPTGPAAETMKMFEAPRDFVFQLQGTKMRSVFGQFEALYSLDTGKIQVIDRQGGRYATSDVGDFDSLARAVRDGAPMGGAAWLKAKLVSLGPGGTGKSAAGIECRVERYALTFVVDGQPPDERMAKVMTAQRFEFDYCNATVPAGMAEYQESQARLMELMASFSSRGGSNPAGAALAGLMTEPLRKLQSEIFAKNLMPVKAATRMYMDVRQMLPPGAAIPPALEALAEAPLLTMTVDTKSYETGQVDAKRLALPEGLQEVTLRELDLTKLMARQ